MTNTDKYFVEQGSIYAPGWHVRERVRPNYLVSVARFDTKQEADEYLAHIREQERREQVITVTITATFDPDVRIVKEFDGVPALATWLREGEWKLRKRKQVGANGLLHLTWVKPCGRVIAEYEIRDLAPDFGGVN